jgi:hypothetical protein
MSRNGTESKEEGRVVKSEVAREHGESRRKTSENTPSEVMKDAGIKITGDKGGISDKHYGNQAHMGHAVAKLSRDTERGKHAPMVGGHKNNHKTH